jgi:hypothetical protein
LEWGHEAVKVHHAGLVMLWGVALALIVMLWLRRIKIDFAFSAEPSPGVRFLHHEEDH